MPIDYFLRDHRLDYEGFLPGWYWSGVTSTGLEAIHKLEGLKVVGVAADS
jgi:hypothetical protein